MSLKNKYKNRDDVRHGGRHFKKSVMAFAAVLCIAAVAVTVFAVKSGIAKEVSNVAPSTTASKSAGSREAASSSRQPVKTTKSIPVLMYHSINYDPKHPTNILRVPKDKFAAEMKWLHDNGYSTLSLDELYDAVSNNKPVPEKSVVMTFDDGYNDNYDNALPIIKQYKLKATVFMITKEIGDSKNGYLTQAQLKEMDENGMRIECHTVTHPDLDTLSYKRQYDELSNSKAALQKLLGRSVDFIAYPSGKYNADTIAAAKKTGYKMCFKMKGGIAMISDDRYEFPRAFVGQDLNDFISRVKGTADYSK